MFFTIMLTLLLLLLIFCPRLSIGFEQPYVRFLLDAFLSVYMGIFIFILYPHDGLIPIPGFDPVLRLAGPLALVLVIFIFYDKYMPSRRVGMLYRPVVDGAAAQINAGAVQVVSDSSDAKGGIYAKVANTEGDLQGIYVEFDSGVFEHKATVTAQYRESKTNVFERYTTNPIVQFGRVITSK